MAVIPLVSELLGFDSIEKKVDNLQSTLDHSFLSKIPSKQDLEDLILRLDQEPKKIEEQTVKLAQDLQQKILVLESNIEKLTKIVHSLSQKVIHLMS